MSTTPTGLPFDLKRSRARLALLLFLCLPLAGCTKSTSPANPDQAPAQKVALAFVADLQSGRYQDADSLMTSDLRAQSTPHVLAAQSKGPYLPFVGAQGWQFQPVNPIRHGKGVELRASFHDPAGHLYYTNFVFIRNTNSLALDQIVTPTASHSPMTRTGGNLSPLKS